MATSHKTLLRSDTSKIEHEREQSLGSLQLITRSKLDENKLPSNRQVLERFFKMQHDHSKTIPKRVVKILYATVGAIFQFQNPLLHLKAWSKCYFS